MHTSDNKCLKDYLMNAYNDTYEKHGQKQAVGAVLAYLLKKDVSFFSGKENREYLSAYSRNDIGFMLLEFIIKKIGYDKVTIDLNSKKDVEKCNNYYDASLVVTNMLIKYDKKNHKIAFGDVINILKVILIYEKVLSFIVNQFVMDLFINERVYDDEVVPFTIKYLDEENEEKVNELNGIKIIAYLRKEYNQ